MDTSPEQRLYDAAARGDDLAAAAADAIADGLDAPSLRALTAAPASTRRRGGLLIAALHELGIPRPDPRVPGQVIDGTPYARLPTDTLRLEIVDGELGPEVLVRINNLNIAEPLDGMGMHPFDLLVPCNRLAELSRVVVGRCGCGEPGCGSTEAQISRTDGVVHWDWFGDAPLDHGVSFDATRYHAEVGRLNWQPPPIDNGLDLTPAGLELTWAGADYRDPQKFLVALNAKDERFQIFLRFPIDIDSDDVRRTLRRPPRTWRATYSSLVVGRRGRPSMAGWRWRSEDAWG
ncbi:hypothetical protein ACQHIV_31830 [Kribbella sp. GL6]|uniref:hypothetical protein n=1 Tax=Kribbella sp. GL6 TaxID=3419765 RepID=UPI003D05FCC8